MEKRIHRLIAILIGLIALTLITSIAKNVIGINAITVALLYLLVVLVTSALADVICGIVTALLSGLLVNYYFLPPFGTFYIEAPEDWISFGVYTITAVVVSHFAATGRRRAVEADQLHAQLSQLSRFTEALMAVPKECMTMEMLTAELRKAYELSYCAIYLFGKTGIASPISSGIRPSHSSQKDGMPPKHPDELLDVVTEEGLNVQCLNLKDKGEIIGALLISQVSLSRQVTEQIAAVISLIIRQNISAQPIGQPT